MNVLNLNCLLHTKTSTTIPSYRHKLISLCVTPSHYSLLSCFFRSSSSSL